MSVYFARHGESLANVEKTFSAPDTPLTDNGRNQARLLATQEELLNVSLIVTSPDDRARETAEIVAREINYDVLKIVVLEELHERRFGHLAGTPRKVDRYYAYTFDADGNAEKRIDLIERMRTALDKLKDLTEQTLGDVLIIGHTVSGFYLREISCGKRAFEEFNDAFHIDNAAVQELRI